ncbi:MAG TPA: phosphoribosyltransferase [Bryobacteraceae bacterium]|nr:phosphoribosyltransferase [Bryobacteraceae bacterium]
MSLPFTDRTDAGRQLARKLAHLRGHPAVVVLALPRGGVPVAFEVAESLEAPLDVFLVRKLGMPGHEELALGAIASGGVRVLNQDVVYMSGIDEQGLDAIAEREQAELERRERAYRAGRGPVEIEGRIVILVDDGLATGATMLAAARAIRRLRPQRLIVAVPVAAPEACNYFQREVDEIVCAETPQPFRAVGLWYEDFSQTTDNEVRDLLARAIPERVHSH